MHSFKPAHLHCHFRHIQYLTTVAVIVVRPHIFVQSLSGSKMSSHQVQPQRFPAEQNWRRVQNLSPRRCKHTLKNPRTDSSKDFWNVIASSPTQTLEKQRDGARVLLSVKSHFTIVGLSDERQVADFKKPELCEPRTRRLWFQQSDF